MRRNSMFGSILVVGLVGLVGGLLLSSRAGAQDESPAAGAAASTPTATIELAPGVTAEVFAAAPSARAAGQTIYLARFTFQSGAEIFPHRHPGTTLLGVESGPLGWTLVEGTAHVLRGAAAGSTEPPEDVTEPGVELTLNPGDAISYEDDVVHTARGTGDGPTVVLGTFVLEAGQPLLMPVDMEMAGTPSP